MLQDTDLVIVACPNCGEQYQKEIGWLKANAWFHCGACNTRLQHDPAELVRALNAKSGDPRPKITMRPS